MKKHPHHLHLGLVAALLVLEFTVFKGRGILSTLSNLGFTFLDNYNAALAGDSAAMEGLIPGVIGFVIALVIYYVLAGVVILLFTIFSKDEEKR